MSQKVTWKKGMRLSTEVFNAMDMAHNESFRLISQLASASRFGLFPSSKPFELSVNINNNALEVVSLSCHGVTKNGNIIDIDFNSAYLNTFDTRITIPAANENDTFLLVVRMYDNQWREVNEIYSEAMYTFELVGENTRLDDHSLPIGCVIKQYGWRLNETDFVPPCLYITAHPRYMEQREKCLRISKSIFDKCIGAQNCIAKYVLSCMGTAAASVFQRTDKEQDTLTPAQLYACLQQLISSFLLGCALEDYVNLENPEPYILYTQKPLDFKNLYKDIEAGIALCSEIDTKITTISSMTMVRDVPPEPEPKPKPKPKPKPEPEPEPKPKPRNRWEGIEI